MGDGTAIQWTDATWNPTVGCSLVSPGCTNCYAMKTAASLERRFGSGKYSGLTTEVKGIPVWNGVVRLDPEALTQPLRWRRGRRIFVNSMSDLFHEALSDSDILQVLDVVRRCSYDGGSNCGKMIGEHTFQVLTKRADRMAKFMPMLRFNNTAGSGDCALYLDDDKYPPVVMRNLWLGVSVEDQARADERIEPLLATPAAVRFLSCEPLLGPLDLKKPVRRIAATRIDWVIVGGESGPRARPFGIEWAQSIVAQCVTDKVPCFVKQIGSNPTVGTVPMAYLTGYASRDRKGGDWAEWPEDLRVREFPK